MSVCSLDPGAGAVDRLYREHAEAVRRFIARRVPDPELAADLTADVFMAAIRTAGGYRAECGSERDWLFGIARHRIADSYRSAAREARLRTAVQSRELPAGDDLAPIHDRLDAQASAGELYAQLDALPAGERAVLELVALDDLSVAEAAQALAISPVAARVRLHRARHRAWLIAAVAGVAALCAVLASWTPAPTLAQAYPILTRPASPLPASLRATLIRQGLAPIGATLTASHAVRFTTTSGTGYAVVANDSRWLCLVVEGVGGGPAAARCSTVTGDHVSGGRLKVVLIDRHGAAQETVALAPGRLTAVARR